MEKKEKEGRKDDQKRKKRKESGVGRHGETRKEKKKKLKEYGVFELMLFWHNFLVFVEVIVGD
jgi:hypothetical protein